MGRFSYRKPGALRGGILIFACLTLTACGHARPGHPQTDPVAARRAALAEIGALPMPMSIAAVAWAKLKAALAREVSASSIVFGPPLSALSRVTDISASDVGGLQLQWSYANRGDYDQNGEVNASDLTPMAPALNLGSDDALWARWTLADGDANGQVNIADITPIGANFRRSIDEYEVQYATVEQGTYNAVGIVPMDQSSIPAGTYVRRFTYLGATAPDGWYRVVPRFLGEPGIPSVAVHYVSGNQAPVARITTDQQFGPTPLVVSFDAAASTDADGSIVKYEWDLDGNGGYETDTGTVAQVQRTYPNVGMYEVHLRVTDERGATGEAHACLGALDWQFYPVEDVDTEFQALRGTIHAGGLPQCVYLQRETISQFDKPNHMIYTVGSTATPQSSSDWTRYEITAPEGEAVGLQLITVNGKPCLFFQVDVSPQSPKKRYYKLGMSNVAVPSSMNDWLFSDVFTVEDVSTEHVTTNLMDLNGRPALTIANKGKHSLDFWTSKVDIPTSPADWQSSQIQAVPDNQVFDFDIAGPFSAAIDGRPVVAYETSYIAEVRFAYADTEMPLASTDWTVCTVASLGSPEDFGFSFEVNGLAVSDGLPTVIFRRTVDNQATCHFSSALSGAPVNSDDWATDTFPVNWSSGRASIVAFDGRPLTICYSTLIGDLWIFAGCNGEPRTIDEWMSDKFIHPLPAGKNPGMGFLRNGGGRVSTTN